MKRKVLIVLILLIGAAFYFGYLRLQTPSLRDIGQAMPVKVDPAKEKELVEAKDKTKNAINAASKELKKTDKKQ